MNKTIAGVSLISVIALGGCGGGSTSTSTTPGLPLTLRASVNAGSATDVTAPHALNLPHIGDSAVVTAYEGNQQVSISLTPASSCTNVIAISPGASAVQQTVTATATGQCNATVQASDGSTATLAIFSLPPP